VSWQVGRSGIGFFTAESWLDGFRGKLHRVQRDGLAGGADGGRELGVDVSEVREDGVENVWERVAGGSSKREAVRRIHEPGTRESN